MPFVCPECSKDAACIDTKRGVMGQRRRWKCPEGHRFSTLEQVALGIRGNHGANGQTANMIPTARLMSVIFRRRRYTLKFVLSRTEYLGRTSRAIGFVFHVDDVPGECNG